MSHGRKKKFTDTYDNIISVENLLLAWKNFQKGKRKKKDVQRFEYRLMENIIGLHLDLKEKTYTHGGYHAFKVNDPKPRDIHKATVRDRVLHHALYRALAPFYLPLFITDSYSCQNNKGAHRGLKRFEQLGRRVSKNNTKTAWVLKCDIRKFFANIDQGILAKILQKRIVDQDILWLLQKVIESFSSTERGKGLPLGNLTSQLLVNIYMHEFDQFMKQSLKVKHYIRYADDFVIFSQDRKGLKTTLVLMDAFLRLNLRLEPHPNKVFIRTLASDVDFLGWVHFPDHRVLRTVTKKRMLKKLKPENLTSYTGMLQWGSGRKLIEILEKEIQILI